MHCVAGTQVLSSDDESEEEDDGSEEGSNAALKVNTRTTNNKLFRYWPRRLGSGRSSHKCVCVRVAQVECESDSEERRSVMPGGRGFKCPKAGCDTFFDTADEAVAHGAAVIVD